MRGRLVVEVSGAHTLAGLWGMSAAAHGVEGQTSPFALKLPAPRGAQPPHAFPASGVYAGHFMLMQAGGKPSLKVEEKAVHLTVVALPEGGHSVQGTGKNRFGHFTVRGTISAGCEVELFREYLPKPAAPPPKVAGAKRPAAAPGAGAAQRARTVPPLSVSPASAVGGAAGSPGSPRGLGGKTIQGLSTQKPAEAEDGGVTPGRAKRATAGDWKDKADLPTPREAPSSSADGGGGGSRSRAPAVERKGKGKEHASPVSSSPAAASSADVPGFAGLGGGTGLADGVELPSSLAAGSQSLHGRVRKAPAHLKEQPAEKLVRLNEHMRKCLGLLRDLQRQPQGAWFAAPVDWRALNLPDYPDVVKRPMDFATVKNNVETGLVETPDEFKASVMLVFKNAMQYNAKKDNVVHIVAAELKVFFEEKFRSQIEPLGPVDTPSEVVARSRKGGGGGGSRGGGGAGSRGGGGGGGGSRRPAASGQRSDFAGSGEHQGYASTVPQGMVSQERFSQLQNQMEMLKQQLSELKRQSSASEASISMAAQLQSAAHLGGGAPSFGGRSSGGGRRQVDERPLTEGEKETLSQEIQSLAHDKIGGVLDIIREGSCLDAGSDEQVEIDLDNIDSGTLRELQRYVKSCLPRKRKKAGGAQQFATPGLEELDNFNLDGDSLEDMVVGGDSKRGRSSLDSNLLDSLPFSQSELPEGLEHYED